MVSVIPRQVNRIELDKTKMEMLVGSDTTLRATVYPENTFNKKIRISSSNESIIKIDENLKLQVLSKGEATITVASEDGSVSDDYKVTAGDITLFISTQHIRTLWVISQAHCTAHCIIAQSIRLI